MMAVSFSIGAHNGTVRELGASEWLVECYTCNGSQKLCGNHESVFGMLKNHSLLVTEEMYLDERLKDALRKASDLGVSTIDEAVK